MHAPANRSERFVLAVDLGTSGVKVGLVSLDGQLGWSEQRTLETRRFAGGGATQDADHWWSIVCELAKRGVGHAGGGRVAAVACTGQWGSVVPVDQAGRPVAPCVMWLDTRGATHARQLIGGPIGGYAPLAALTWIRRTAGAPSPYGGDPVSNMLHLDRDEPKTAAAARWYLEPCDYLTMRFVGKPVASHASMIGAWMTDNRHLDRLHYDKRLVRMAGIDETKLPPLVETGSVVGTVKDDVAATIGLSGRVQVVAGIPDLHSAALGSGATREHETHMSIGTTSWISLPFRRKKTDVRHSIATVPGLDDKSYLVADNHEAAGLCLRWLREQCLATGSGDSAPSFDDLTRAAAEAPPGSNRLIFTPWIAGERSPVDDRNARGGWHNVSVSTTRADLIRAVLEGVAYNSRWLHVAVERFAGRRLDDIRLLGAGALSDLWCEIHADVMDRRIERVADPAHVNLRGVALLASLALGAVRPDELRELVEVDRRFTPNPDNRRIYDRLYAEFPGLYRSQRGMFSRLNGA